MKNIIREMIEKAIYYKETIKSIDEAYELIRFTRDLIERFAETINCPSNWRSIGEDVVNNWRIIKEKLERLAEKENGLYNFEV